MNSAFLCDLGYEHAHGQPNGPRQLFEPVSAAQASEKNKKKMDAHHARHFVIRPTPFAQERIDLVDKDDGRLEFACERKEGRHQLVRLAEPVFGGRCSVGQPAGIADLK